MNRFLNVNLMNLDVFEDYKDNVNSIYVLHSYMYVMFPFEQNISNLK